MVIQCSSQPSVGTSPKIIRRKKWRKQQYTITHQSTVYSTERLTISTSELNLVSGRAFFSRVRESVLLNTAPKQEIYHGHILHCCRISSNIMIQGKLLTIILVQPNTCWKPYHDPPICWRILYEQITENAATHTLPTVQVCAALDISSTYVVNHCTQNIDFFSLI